MHDFIISIATYDRIQGNIRKDYKLSDYKATKDKTTWKIMRETVINVNKEKEILWVSVGLTMNTQFICVMKGTLAWLTKVEYFQKFIGSAADDDFKQAGFGFLDMEKNLRVEFENGMINILPQA